MDSPWFNDACEDEFSNSSGETEPLCLRQGRSVSCYRIGTDIHQPSFLSLTNHLITKYGEEIGKKSADRDQQLLNQINIDDNHGKFENPIIVIDDNNKDRLNAYPCNNLSRSMPINLKAKPIQRYSADETYDVIQSKIAKQLCQRHKQIWERIGYVYQK
ncbi:hypothetical protein TVAG_444550 [Trichomonas vaginalis G3]|uniref:Uncharacterized protein n=1 Tax=Trichomonas vaginalis (strain ATCC PRA-98 / G3) TaxID=412133 RepID=A2E2J6_TRIV3|nr:hypothetical protein TVAGG3_0306330 [Trichomonas vaginalis G3]EAY13171.1 hypothetical protein TVAG_444550 [Trichomonas vaginalis G3]KAI5528282.1 hypothetical protein TVAGG3_0306330 [Trichomonas vaginalis G3]|eukprot:XP_001325394.1 hypothetical protein [Trichomonas vaginalis G3]